MSKTLSISLSCSSMDAMKRLLILEEGKIHMFCDNRYISIIYIAKNSTATLSAHRPIGQSRVMHGIVVGTVTAVNKDNEWYYLGCESCNRKASPSLIFPEDDNGSDDVDMKEVLGCTNNDCKRDVVPAVYMYLINIYYLSNISYYSTTLTYPFICYCIDFGKKNCLGF
ncbi:hypothetical protein Hdeb2414_s0002g00055841 [Helianthus debilis subsp. tardiflorus]